MADHARLLPEDDHNRTLIARTHPPDWVNPDPASNYNLVVIGAGTAGLVSAAGAAGVGARVALVERHLMGGDCLVAGCVPSKSIIRSSRVMADLKDAAAYGVGVDGEAKVDFAAVMERMRRIRAAISEHDAAARFRDLGVDVFLGDARFTGPRTVEVDGKKLRFSKAVIATGSRPVEPKIEGLAEAGYITNETVFQLTEQPRRLAIIGGGPIGCEMAQAFQRLGTQVTLIHKHNRLMNRDEPEASAIVQDVFTREGVALKLEQAPSRVTQRDGEKRIALGNGEDAEDVVVDEILVGAGRAPNVQDLGLDAAGVEHDARKGVQVDDHLRTTNSRVYAAGDCCMKLKFTHAADAAARIVVQNALFPGFGKKLSALHVPWCTYVDPEVAHVGLSEAQAKERGEVDVYLRELKDVDRAMADGEITGFTKIICRKGSDSLLGATMVARHAGESISEITLAMVARLGLGTLGQVIHPYPTQAEAIKQAADAYNRTRLTPWVKGLFDRWLRWTR